MIGYSNQSHIHAGRTETSAILFIRPDLVAPGYRTAPSLPGQNFDDLIRIAEAPDWPGYFGPPRQATAAEGQARMQQRAQVAADFMWRIVEGAVDERELPRFATTRPEASLKIDQAAGAHERAREERFAAWLAQRQAPPRLSAERRLPIIDMHLHARPADGYGPPPLGLCVPLLPHVPPLDPGRKVFRAVSKEPPCADPIWSPLTDEAVMEQTIEVLERRNIIGVVSGTPERVRRWHEAAPHRFIPGIDFQLGPDALSPDALRRLFGAGPFASWARRATSTSGSPPTTSGWRRTGRSPRSSTSPSPSTWARDLPGPPT